VGIGVLPQARREVQGGMRNLSAQQMVITANDLKGAGIGVGYHGDFEKHLAAREAKAVELFNEIERSGHLYEGTCVVAVH
jgi:hypothetical protein